MKRFSFGLVSPIQTALADVPVPVAPDTLNLALGGGVAVVAKGDRVLRGQRLSAHADPLAPDVFAPLAGTVTALSCEAVSIAPDASGETVPAAPFTELTGGPGERQARLKELGFDPARFRPAAILVVNGLNPEPGVSVADQLLHSASEAVALGLALARAATGAAKAYFVAAPANAHTLPDTTRVNLPAVYPNSLDELAVRAATGRENPPDVAVLSVLELYLLGTAAAEGLPVAHTVMTVNGTNYRVTLGTPAGLILQAAGLEAHPLDRLVLGGVLRGRAAYSPAQGAAPGDYGLFVIRHGDYPPVTDQACMNCGECFFVCPARIRPGLVSRYAEFCLYERAAEHGLLSCIECGLCGYVCVGRRPILQYIRLAKEELAAKAACATL